jgi:hypothetical protein
MDALNRIVKEIKVEINPWFVGSVILYFLVRTLRVYSWIELPNFLLYNLTDFLCLPILLTIANLLIKILFPSQCFKISVSQIVLLVLFYSVLFECILPKVSTKYTADYLDVIMYFLGGGFYWLLSRNKISSVN